MRPGGKTGPASGIRECATVGGEGWEARRGRASPSTEVCSVGDTAGRADPDHQANIPVPTHCRATLEFTYQNLSFVIKNIQKFLPTLHVLTD